MAYTRLRGVALVVALLCPILVSGQSSAQEVSVERWRYVALIAGCNACHTEDFGPSAGNVSQNLWLTGSSIGHRGPWGTTYPPNLRIYMQRVSADQWVKNARTVVMRPPMPWFDLRMLTDEDLRALHAFVRSLGPVGQPAPNFVPPGIEPSGAVILYPMPPATTKPSSH